MFTQTAHWSAIIATVSLSFSQPVFAQEAAPDPVLLERLEEVTDVLADIADVTAPAADLAGSVIDAVGADAADLVDYMGARVGYVPYTGVLRGADGTLRSGYGNSYDQSLALITLLRRAGYEAQILVGPATEGVFSETRVPLPEPANVEDIADLIAELEELTDDLVAEGLVSAPVALPDIAGQAFDPTIADQAAAAAVDLLGLTATDRAPEAPDLYALVRHRQGPSDPWTYADPAKNMAFETLDTAPYEKLSSQLPDAHLHFVEVQVIAQSENFGSVRVAQVSAPASNLSTRPIAFAFVPSGEAFGVEDMAPFDPGQDLVFASDTLPQAVITLSGQSIPVDVAASAMAGVFQTGSALMGDAMSSLAEEDVAEAALLDRIVMTVTTQGPARKPMRVAERTLLSREDITALMGPLPMDELRSAMLAAASGNVLLYSGIAPRIAAESDAEKLTMLASILTDLVDNPLNPGDPNAVIVFANLLLHDALAQILADTEMAQHAASSVAMLRVTRPFRQATGFDAAALLTDIVMDGRVASDPTAAFRLATATAGAERDTMARILAALEYPPARIGSFTALENALAAGVAPLTYDQFLATMPDDIAPDRAMQLEFLAARAEAGQQLAIWPAETVEATVWLEHEGDTNFARLASGLGGGQETVEGVLLKVNIALYLAVINLAGCVAKAPKAAPGATQNCLTCTGVKFGLALAGVGTLGFGATAMLGASSLIIEGSCL
ncbi:MAG: transglutaminase family protein [Pseudomonadota bacterium]